MSHQAALRQTPSGFAFVTEAALEGFIWENLQTLLGLTPLKRQYICKGEVCGILATDEQRRLVILELKNGEDRYIVQQLTRYYANLLEEKPFADKIDYDQAIRLVAIAPTFHRHNLTDHQYSRLDIDLLQLRIRDDGTRPVLQFVDLEGTPLHTLPLHWEKAPMSSPEDIPEPPDLLQKWLSGCTPAEQKGFLGLRNRLLASSDHMKEQVERGAIFYGTGKSRLCAEIRYERKKQKPILFLWLPTPSSYRRTAHLPPEQQKKPSIGRLRCWTNGQTISHVGHVPDGLGRMKTDAEWQEVPPSKRPKGLTWSLSSKSHIPTDTVGYLGTHKQEIQPDYWETLADMAIAAWLERKK